MQAGSGKCDHRLEMAILYYVRNFRKAFITDGRGVPSLSLSDITTSGKDKVGFNALLFLFPVARLVSPRFS